MDETQYRQLIKKLHHEACERGELSYIDPLSGYLVFTELNHKQRGSCCQSGCRHCPWQKNEQDFEH